MSNDINQAQVTERDLPASGLLLSVESLSESIPLSAAPLDVDDDKAPADTDGDDTVGDTDGTDETDSDTTDDADGTD